MNVLSKPHLCEKLYKLVDIQKEATVHVVLSKLSTRLVLMTADSTLSSQEEVLEKGKERGIRRLSVFRYWPSGEKATDLTVSERPSSALRQILLAAHLKATQPQSGR